MLPVVTVLCRMTRAMTRFDPRRRRRPHLPSPVKGKAETGAVMKAHVLRSSQPTGHAATEQAVAIFLASLSSTHRASESTAFRPSRDVVAYLKAVDENVKQSKETTWPRDKDFMTEGVLEGKLVRGEFVSEAVARGSQPAASEKSMSALLEVVRLTEKHTVRSEDEPPTLEAARAYAAQGWYHLTTEVWDASEPLLSVGGWLLRSSEPGSSRPDRPWSAFPRLGDEPDWPAVPSEAQHRALPTGWNFVRLVRAQDSSTWCVGEAEWQTYRRGADPEQDLLMPLLRTRAMRQVKTAERALGRETRVLYSNGLGSTSSLIHTWASRCVTTVREKKSLYEALRDQPTTTPVPFGFVFLDCQAPWATDGAVAATAAAARPSQLPARDLSLLLHLGLLERPGGVLCCSFPGRLSVEERYFVSASIVHRAARVGYRLHEQPLALDATSEEEVGDSAVFRFVSE